MPSAALTEAPDGTTLLAFGDGKGKTRAVLGVRRDGTPALGVRDEDEETRASLALEPDGQSGLVLLDTKRKQRVALGTTGGRAGVVLLEAEKVRGTFGLVEGSPGLSFHDKGEQVRVVLGAGSQDRMALTFVDRKGRSRAALISEPEDVSSLLFRTEDCNVVWKAP